MRNQYTSHDIFTYHESQVYMYHASQVYVTYGIMSHEYSTIMPQIQHIATHKENSLKQPLVLASRPT